MERHLQYANTAADETAVLVSAVPSNVARLFASNPHTAMTYLQMFDAADAGDVTVGTTAPNYSIGIPAGGTVVIEKLCLEFGLGLVIAVTAGAANATAPGADAVLNIGYKQI